MRGSGGEKDNHKTKEKTKQRKTIHEKGQMSSGAVVAVETNETGNSESRDPGPLVKLSLGYDGPAGLSPQIVQLSTKEVLTPWDQFVSWLNLITGLRILAWGHPLRRDNRYDSAFWASFFSVVKFLALGRALGDQAWDVVVINQSGSILIAPDAFGPNITMSAPTSIKRWFQGMSARAYSQDYLLEIPDGTLSILLNRLSGGIFQPVDGLNWTEISLLSVAMIMSCIQVLGIMIFVGNEFTQSNWFLERLRKAEESMAKMAKGEVKRVRLPMFKAMMVFISIMFFSDVLMWIGFALYVGRYRPSQVEVFLDVSTLVVVNNGTSYVPLAPGEPPVYIDFGTQSVVHGNGYYSAITALVFSVVAIVCTCWQIAVLYILGKRAYRKMLAESASAELDSPLNQVSSGAEDVMLRDAVGPILATMEQNHLAGETSTTAKQQRRIVIEAKFKETLATHSDMVAQYMILIPKSRRRILLALALFSIMLLIGAGAFMGLSFIGTNQRFWPLYPARQNPTLPIPPVIVPFPYDPWTFSEAYYFTLTTALVIGYGSMVPQSNAARAFLIFYGTIGIAVSANFLLATRDFLLLQAQRQAVSSVLLLEAKQRREATHRVEDENDDVLDDEQIQEAVSKKVADPRETRMTHIFLIVRIIFLCLIYWLVGAWLFTLVEAEWSYFDSLYFLYVSAATIGLGDFVPSSPAGWELLGIFVGLMLPLFALVLSGVQEFLTWAADMGKAKQHEEAEKERALELSRKITEWSTPPTVSVG